LNRKFNLNVTPHCHQIVHHLKGAGKVISYARNPFCWPSEIWQMSDRLSQRKSGRMASVCVGVPHEWTANAVFFPQWMSPETEMHRGCHLPIFPVFDRGKTPKRSSFHWLQSRSMETILLNGPNCRTPIRAKRFGRISATRHRIKLAPLSLRISLEYMLKNKIRMTYKWIFLNENQLVGEGRIK